MQEKFRSKRSIVAAVALLVLLSGCSSDELTVANGPRIAALTLASTPTTVTSGKTAQIPAAVANDKWPNSGGFSDHLNQNLKINDEVSLAWQTAITDAPVNTSAGLTWVPPSPVVARGRIFTLGSDLSVKAHAIKNGRLLWNTQLLNDEDETLPPHGGGISVSSVAVVAVTGDGFVAALNPKSGKTLWSTKLNRAVRSAPSIVGDQVIIVALDDGVISLQADSGEILWSHPAAETTTLQVGHVAPAIAGNEVIVSRHSGEVLVLDRATGRLKWSDFRSLRAGRPLLLEVIPSISSPVATPDAVVASTANLHLTVFNRQTGARAWSRDIRRVQTAAVAGTTVFVVSNYWQLFAIDGRDGTTLWNTFLPRQYTVGSSASETRTIKWYGPVLAGDRLLITGSDGSLLSVSPFDGKILGRVHNSIGFVTPPIVSNGTIFAIDATEVISAFR